MKNKFEMDLKLDMDMDQAMHYFWRVLDVQGEGRLTVSTISLFFRDVAHALREGGFETPHTEDVKVLLYTLRDLT